jgi:hypothetical protein
VLGEDLEAALAGLNLEGEVAAASAGAKFRTQKTASALGLWSRSWLSRLEALHAVQWGNYQSAIVLVRAAADSCAGMLYLLETGAREWQEWLDDDGIAIAAEQHATQFRLHAFRAAEVLAAHETLGRIYRVSMDLSLSHFGSTLLIAGSGSAPDHVEMSFGDRDFHVALAQLCTGWLLELSGAHLEAADRFPDSFGSLGDERTALWRTSAEVLLSSPQRCRIESIEIGPEARYLISNWRREPRSAAKRILL